MLDRRQLYRNRAHENAATDIGPWLSVTILSDSSRRAKKLGLEFSIDRNYLIELWNKQNGCCAVSGIKLETQSGTREDKNPFRASLDRIDNNDGYVKGNVRFTAHWVNNAKSTWTDEIFEIFVENISKMRQ